MDTIPDFIVAAAVAADEITEQELMEDQKKNSEFWVSFWVSVGCVILLYFAVIGALLMEE